MQKYLSILLLFGTVFTAVAQKEKDYLKKINANYLELTAMEALLSYELYRGLGDELLDEYTTTYKFNEEASYRKIYNEEVITQGDMMLVLDHELKTIQLSNYQKVPVEMIDKQLKKSLKYCNDILVEENGENTVLSIMYNTDATIPYSRVEVTVDKNYWINHITFFYATQMNFSQDSFNPDYDFPRLELSYTTLKKKWKDKEGIARLDNYVTLVDSVYQPTALYKEYEIINTSY